MLAMNPYGLAYQIRPKRQVEIPAELQQVLDNRPVCFCANCNVVSEPAVYRHNLWLTFCFLPLVRLNKGPALLGCSLCAGELCIGSRENTCTGCDRWNPRPSGYCPHCGTRIHAAQATTDDLRVESTWPTVLDVPYQFTASVDASPQLAPAA